MEKLIEQLKKKAAAIRQRLDEENNPANIEMDSKLGYRHKDITSITFNEGYAEALEEVIEMIEDELKEKV